MIVVAKNSTFPRMNYENLIKILINAFWFVARQTNIDQNISNSLPHL